MDMQKQVISANRVNVTVSGQTFSIPSEKVSELYRLLQNWQAIAMTENSSPSQASFYGQQLIHG